jgi:hypothetical protein
MIKWLICLIWGHNLDMTQTLNLRRRTDNTVAGVQALCKRCQHYRFITNRSIGDF